MKNIAKKIHKKYPYIDPLINMLLGAGIGGFLSVFVDQLIGNDDWHFWKYGSFWCIIGVVVISIIYFKFFSMYTSMPHISVEEAIDNFNIELIHAATESMDDPERITKLLHSARKVGSYVSKINKEGGQ